MKRLEKKLNAWRAKLENAGSDAAWRAAQRGGEIARAYVPVDSGELRSGITAQQSGSGAAVISAAPHAAMLEYGTSRMPAQPYMLPMTEDMRGEFAAMAAKTAGEVFV